MEEKRQGSLYAHTLLLVGAALLLAWIIHSALNERPVTVPDADKVTGADRFLVPPSMVCPMIVRECHARAEVKFAECDEAIGRRKVGLALGDPLDADGCSELSRAFDEVCGGGCRLDRDHLLIIPGTLLFEFAERPDESGNCMARAVQPITVRGRCLPIERSRGKAQDKKQR